MKILDVPEDFKHVDENESTRLENQIMKKINIPKRDYFRCLSQPKRIRGFGGLKDYSAIKSSLDLLQSIQVNTNNEIIDLKKDYKDKSLFVDPNVCILEITNK